MPTLLSAASFAKYPPEARAIAVAHLELLRQLSPTLLFGLLRELIDYDVKFPAERAGLDRQISFLNELAPADRAGCLAGFAAIRVSPEEAWMSWYARPLDASEQMSAYLWRTHQLDAFRVAAVAYGERLAKVAPPPALPMPRLGIAVIGQGANALQPQLFAKLRERGTLFTAVDPTDGLAVLLRAVEARAAAHAVPYAHWYVDGGTPIQHSERVTVVSYGVLAPARAALFAYIQKQVAKPGMGPEELRDRMANLDPAELGLAGDSLLNHFQVKMLTEGSGTQVFSTTFAQWTTREALRRAEPLTMLVRFAPRQRQRPMNELLAGDEQTPQLDPAGSLVDADMAAYYHWINQGRLAGADHSSFLAWHEGQRMALLVSPGLPRGTESRQAISMDRLMSLTGA